MELGLAPSAGVPAKSHYFCGQTALFCPTAFGRAFAATQDTVEAVAVSQDSNWQPPGLFRGSAHSDIALLCFDVPCFVNDDALCFK